jgi:hypothetical protein
MEESRRRLNAVMSRPGEIAVDVKPGIDATKKLPGFKRPWPPLIKMDAAVKAKMEKIFGLC